MALEVKHLFQSAKGDGPDNTLVQPSDWNALHVLTSDPGLVGNPTGAAGAIVEIPIGAGLAFNAGVLESTIKGLPIGSVLPFGGDFQPNGWLFCFGQAVSRVTFATLFSVIKEIYGVGDGSTTFNVPDLRGRAAVGRDNMGGTAANRVKDTVDGKLLNSTIGTERHILTSAQLAAHTHTGTTEAAPSHRHFTTVLGDADDSNPTITADESIVSANTAGSHPYKLNGVTTTPAVGRTSESGSHNHTLTLANAGADEPHLNMQPSIILNYIIWAGATA